MLQFDQGIVCSGIHNRASAVLNRQDQAGLATGNVEQRLFPNQLEFCAMLVHWFHPILQKFY